LLFYKLLLLSDVTLDFVQQQVDCFFLVILDFLELIEKSLDVVWRIDLEVVSATLVEQEGELPFTFLALLDLLGVGQVEGLVLFVEIYELSLADVSEVIHYVPGVVL